MALAETMRTGLNDQARVDRQVDVARQILKAHTDTLDRLTTNPDLSGQKERLRALRGGCLRNIAGLPGGNALVDAQR